MVLSLTPSPFGAAASPLRDLWSEDMADAAKHILLNVSFDQLKPSAPTPIRNTHINIRSGEEISIQALAHLIAQTLHYKGTIKWDTTKPDGTPRKLCDSSKLRTLGWQPCTPLSTGLELLHTHYLSTLK